MAEKAYRKGANIVARKIAGDLFLIPIRGRIADMQRIFALNPAGEYIWQEMENRKGIEEIRQGMADRFDIEEEKAETDIREFIAELMEAGLIGE
jgi:hypothetical protein